MKYFCSILTDLSNLLLLYHQLFPLLSYDLKNVLSKQFRKMQKQLGVLINFPIASRKYLVLKPLFNAVRDRKACNFNVNETPTQVFSCEYHKIFKNSFLWNTSAGCFWIWLKNFQEFLIQARLCKSYCKHSFLYASGDI